MHAILGSLVVKLPGNLDFAAGITILVCHTTAIQALLKISQIREDHYPLICSAAGGVGHAAIELAKMVSAEIHATIGYAEKVRYMQKAHNIPRTLIQFTG